MGLHGLIINTIHNAQLWSCNRIGSVSALDQFVQSTQLMYWTHCCFVAHYYHPQNHFLSTSTRTGHPQQPFHINPNWTPTTTISHQPVLDIHNNHFASTRTGYPQQPFHINPYWIPTTTISHQPVLDTYNNHFTSTRTGYPHQPFHISDTSDT